jgi:glutamine amidotransferase
MAKRNYFSNEGDFGMISILDYGMGNIQSVYNAFRFIEAETRIIKPKEISKAKILVFPGVGSFKDTLELIEPYKKELIIYLNSGRPFLGICIGLQFLFESSDENKKCAGLGFFKGKVTKLKSKKLPQIGWNKLIVKQMNPILKNVKSGDFVYYINSYATSPQKALATSRYNNEFSAIVNKGNVFATQFHPEKSGKVGLIILKNFIEVTRCL